MKDPINLGVIPSATVTEAKTKIEYSISGNCLFCFFTFSDCYIAFKKEGSRKFFFFLFSRKEEV